MPDGAWVSQWPQRERAELFQETAARSELGSKIAIEKDYWVCWSLRAIFKLPSAEHLVFKGGTSLSKVYGVIHRFSEDIDISLDRSALGFTGDQDPKNATSKSKADALVKTIRPACVKWVNTKGLPSLEGHFRAGLPVGEEWALTPHPGDPETLLFRYPQAFSATEYGTSDYIKPTIRIEFGARNDTSPYADAIVESYCKTHLSAVVPDQPAQVRVLAAERTFWEKATILHAEANRPGHSSSENALSRHYYDLAMLAKTPIADRALADLELGIQVARHKELFFRAGWAKYDEARPGTFKLLPPPALEQELRQDYSRMGVMFFREPPTFDTVLSTLEELEKRINEGG